MGIYFTIPKPYKERLTLNGAGSALGSREKKEWFVLRTKYAQEKRAQRELSNQSIQTFLPLHVIHRKMSDGHKVAERIPLFGRYIFARLHWTTQCGPVMSTRGVQGFVGYQYGGSNKAPVVESAVIKELQRRLTEINGYMVFVDEQVAPIQIHPDTMVKILFGPFKDHVVKVKGVQPGRAEVLLNLLGKTFVYRLPKEHLAIAA